MASVPHISPLCATSLHHSARTGAVNARSRAAAAGRAGVGEMAARPAQARSGGAVGRGGAVDRGGREVAPDKRCPALLRMCIPVRYDSVCCWTAATGRGVIVAAARGRLRARAFQGEGGNAPSRSRSGTSTTVVRICPWRSLLRGGCVWPTRGAIGSAAAATAQRPAAAALAQRPAAAALA